MANEKNKVLDLDKKDVKSFMEYIANNNYCIDVSDKVNTVQYIVSKETK